MSFVATAVGLGVTGIGLVGKSIARHKANKQLSQLQTQDPTYTANPLVGQQFDLAKQLFYGRMAGAPQEERNIFTNNANFNAQVGRNASDGSQALALAAAGQGQSDQAFSNLQLKEQQNKYSLLGNLNNAYGEMIGEGDKVFADQTRKFGNKVQIQGAKSQNNQQGWQDFSNFGMGIANIGLSGGFGSGFGSGGGAYRTFPQNNGGMSGGNPGWSPKDRYTYP